MVRHGNDLQERVILISNQLPTETIGHRKGKFLCHIWLEDLWMNLKAGKYLVIFRVMRVRLNLKFPSVI